MFLKQGLRKTAPVFSVRIFRRLKQAELPPAGSFPQKKPPGFPGGFLYSKFYLQVVLCVIRIVCGIEFHISVFHTV